MPREAACARAARWAAARWAGVMAARAASRTVWWASRVSGASSRGDVAGDEVQQGGGDDRRVDVDAGQVQGRPPVASSSSARVGGRPPGQRAASQPWPSSTRSSGAGGGELADPGEGRLQGGGAGQVEAGEGQTGGGGVHMGVGEGRGDQGAVEVDHLVHTIGERVGGASEPTQATRPRSTTIAVAKGSAGLCTRRGGAGRSWGLGGALTIADSAPAARAEPHLGQVKGGFAGGGQIFGGRASYGVEEHHRRPGLHPGQRAQPGEQFLQFVRGGDAHLGGCSSRRRPRCGRLRSRGRRRDGPRCRRGRWGSNGFTEMNAVSGSPTASGVDYRA